MGRVAVIVRALLLGVGFCAVTGCASVEVSMPSIPGMTKASIAEEDAREREELRSALAKLEERPWTPAEDREDGFVTLLFGGSVTSPKHQAAAYVDSLEGDVALEVRRDLEQTLAAAWNVAQKGRTATTAMEPLPTDLRTIEDAIVEARHCRIVYAEALLLLAKRDEGVSRDEIRRVKQQFNQAIMELGRTADALSVRLDGGEPVNSVAEATSAR
ncbi:hypothetical protein [Parvularcula mediterranea]|nr:hypothetical protein [Parvularcula mediterranea]